MPKPIDMFLTKEAFEQYTQRLREQTAASYGMTVEQWDAAVLGQHIITQSSQQPLINPKPCLHSQCQECFGLGFKRDGTPCVHYISCPCPKCSPKY